MSKQDWDHIPLTELVTAEWKTRSVMLSGMLISRAELLWNSQGVAAMLLRFTKETAMPELKHCPNCNDQKSVCRRCGRTPDQLYATNVPPCNGAKVHEFIACPECSKK